METYVRTIVLYLIAGLAEIGGGWLVWQWLREGKGLMWGLIGGAFSYLWCDPHPSGGTGVRPSVRGVWRYFYHAIHLVGSCCG
jgi:hypothetical protein